MLDISEDSISDKPKRKSGEGFRGGSDAINRAGRKPSDGTKPTNRQLRERELLMLLRKIKPHIAESIVQASKIMKNEDASHMNQLKAATLLIDAYRKLTLDLYDGAEIADEEGTEIQEQNKPAFSLTMINAK